MRSTLNPRACKVLLAVPHVEGANIADRERWEGIVLVVPEAAKVFRAMSDAAHNAAGHTAGRQRGIFDQSHCR
jgi:hypothetical protein